MNYELSPTSTIANPLEPTISKEGLTHALQEATANPNHRRQYARAIERALEVWGALDDALDGVWEYTLKATPQEIRDTYPRHFTQDEAEAIAYQVAGIIARRLGDSPEWMEGYGFPSFFWRFGSNRDNEPLKLVYDGANFGLGFWVMNWTTGVWDSGVLGYPELHLWDEQDEMNGRTLVELVGAFMDEAQAL